MENKDKIILDLCGGTGAWSKPYKDNGYTVHNITLPYYDITKVKYTTYWSTEMIVFDEFLAISSDKVYGILAAPPCTMFSFARTNAKERREFRGDALNVVHACLDIVWHCRSVKGSNLKFWALENPKGYLRQFLGKAPYEFSPEEFGHHYTKKTEIWGYFNFPTKNPITLTEHELEECRGHTNDYRLPELPENYVVPGTTSKRAARRAITPSGFAEAFYKANK